MPAPAAVAAPVTPATTTPATGVAQTVTTVVSGLNAPYNAVVYNGLVYISDYANFRTIVWAENNTTVTNPVAVYPSITNSPSFVSVDSHGNLFVNETTQIVKYAAGSKSGTIGIKLNNDGTNFYRFAVTDNGTIYTTGSDELVRKWPPNANTNTIVAGSLQTGTGSNQFASPHGIFVRSDTIYVADLYNNRIQMYLPNASSGITVAGGNGAGDAANQLYHPIDIFVDSSNAMYIADMDNRRIQKWQLGATSGVTVAGGNGIGSNADQLSMPTSIFVDLSGNMYIADQSNNRIQKWSKK